MKVFLVIIAALVFSIIAAMAFPDATIWQVAIVPAAVLFAVFTFNAIRGS